MRGRAILRLVLISAALILALAPLPPAVVERYYADWWYPGMQARVTVWANLSPWAIFDVIGGAAVVFLLAAWVPAVRRAVRARSVRPLGASAMATVTLTAALFLWFEVSWGLNYAREPLEQVVRYDPSRVTPEAVLALAERAVAAVNATYADAHAAGFPQVHEIPAGLVAAFHDVERQLERPRTTIPTRPKRSLLGLWLRIAAVDGMHTPFLLETLLNPDLTPPERPAVLAHEWAHLAGYAPEDDASFVGLLAALRADPASRYSGWFSLLNDVVTQLPGPRQRELLLRLDPGPRADLRAMVRRADSQIRVVARASWEIYDRYLRAQGVDQGVASYRRVVQLLIGSGALESLP